VSETERMHSDYSPEHLDYVRLREAQERAAAKRAKTLHARRSHQELAQHYAELAAGRRSAG
jgi:hypothetical protein